MRGRVEVKTASIARGVDLEVGGVAGFGGAGAVEDEGVVDLGVGGQRPGAEFDRPCW